MGRNQDSDFVFVGGDIALDLVNTVMIVDGEPADFLASPDELASWVGASELSAQFGRPTEVDPQVYEQVIELRSAIKAISHSLAEAEPIPAAALNIVNRALQRAPGSELHQSADGVVVRSSLIDLTRDPSWISWILADAAASLLCSDKSHRVRRCANHDTCVLLFVDTSRSRSRRWCSMELCGNRHKVAAHHARSRDQSLKN